MASKHSTIKRLLPKPVSMPGKTRKSVSLSRNAWGLIWGLAGLICLLSLFPFDGYVLDVLQIITGALLGVGSYIVPLALFSTAILLWAQPRGSVRCRGICIGLLPFFGGGIVHAFLCPEQYPLSFDLLRDLVQTGLKNQSGGLLAGGFYILLEWALSPIGAFLILLILSAVSLLTVFRITPLVLWKTFRTWRRVREKKRTSKVSKKPQTPEMPVVPMRHPVEILPESHRKIPKQIDIPLDTTPPMPDKLTDIPVKPHRTKRKIDRSLVEEPTVPLQTPLTSLSDLISHAAQESAGIVSDSAEPEKAQQPEPFDEQMALSETIDENQKAAVPVYAYPPLSLLHSGTPTTVQETETELKTSAEYLIDTLQSFRITAQLIGIVRGPSVTRFELSIPRGVKIARISSLSEDIALSLGASSVRIAPIPDKMAVGIEVPNKIVQTVWIRDCIASAAFTNAVSRLSFAVGKDITGKPVICDISKMPHLLIAGTTGAGKSVCINAMLISILYKSRPEEVRLIMIDPKMVELGNYNGIPHLLIPVVTDPKKAAGALHWAVGEMERRYQLFAEHQVRNLSGYNQFIRAERARAEQEEGEILTTYQILPQIVIVIDELADLMMAAAKEVETAICRIAQKARAAGMHLVVATQRPSADVITGIMKANIPSRIAFAVASHMESRIILDQTGAEKLMGKGDMLYAPLGEEKPIRIQGCFISSDEITAVIQHSKETSITEYNEEILEHIERQTEQNKRNKTDNNSDELFQKAIETILNSQQATVSLLQRNLKISYTRAKHLMTQLEEQGVVGHAEGSKSRRILISDADEKEVVMQK